jgi:hypothetical protein
MKPLRVYTVSANNVRLVVMLVFRTPATVPAARVVTETSALNCDGPVERIACTR